MKTNTKTILSHLAGVLIFILITSLIWTQSEHLLQKFAAFVLLIIFVGLIVLSLHLRLREALQLLSQYDSDTVIQRRILHLQQTMLELSNHMTKVNSLKELLDYILKKAIEVIPEAEFGSILVMNDKGKLEFKAIYGFDDNLFQVHLDPKECFQWRATGGVFNGPLIIQDLFELSKDFMTYDTYSKMNELDALSPRSSLSVPLLIDDQFFGVINIDSINVNVFREEHKELMAYFANQATIAISHHQYYQKMLYLSKYDGLTGVLNRHYFQELIDGMLNEHTSKQKLVTFVIMDLNHFKMINDQYGHASGDKILTSFAHSFSSQLKESDLFARYGGDEFVAVFFNSDSQRTTHKLKAIHEFITKEPMHLTSASQGIHCHFSYGIAEFPAEGTDLKSLLHLADQRMYEHKNTKLV